MYSTIREIQQNMDVNKSSSTFGSLKIDEWLIKQCKSLGKVGIYRSHMLMTGFWLFMFSQEWKNLPQYKLNVYLPY